MDIKKIIQEVLWNPEYKNSVITDKDIIGRKVGDVFQGFDGIEQIANKTITYAKIIGGGTYTFDSLQNAEDFIEDEGYLSGRLMEQGNYPIPFIKKDKLKDTASTILGNQSIAIQTKDGKLSPFYDTGWDELGIDAINMLDGVLLSEDFDNKEIYAIFFEFPMNEGKKKKKKQLTMALPIGKIFTAGGTIGESKEMKTHIITKEEFGKIVKEELQRLSEQVYNIQNLANFVAKNETNDPEMQEIYEPIYLEILQKAFAENGDEGVIEAFKGMWGKELFPIGKGRYSFEKVYAENLNRKI